jgi:hypothetical protein
MQISVSDTLNSQEGKCFTAAGYDIVLTHSGVLGVSSFAAVRYLVRENQIELFDVSNILRGVYLHPQ